MWGVNLPHRPLDGDRPGGLILLRDVVRQPRLRDVVRPRRQRGAAHARHRDVLGEASPVMVRTGCCLDGVRLSGHRRRVPNGASPAMVRTGCCLDAALRGGLHRGVRRVPAPRLALVLAGRRAWLPTILPALPVPLREPEVPRLPAREPKPGFPGVLFPVPSVRGQPGWQPSATQEWESWGWTMGLLPVPVPPWLALVQRLAWLLLVHPGMRREVSSRRVPQWLMRRSGRIRPAPAVWLLHLLK